MIAASHINQLWMRKPQLIVIVFLLVAFCSAQQPAWQPAPGHLTLLLWPHGAPGAQPNLPAEVNQSTSKNDIAGKSVFILANVSRPTITLYQPDKNPDGRAIVVFPGGGYRILAIDLEGTEVCQWLNSIHVACILLKYRVPNTGTYPKSSAALQDAQRAFGMVRQHAAEWHINPRRIGVLGFSAGANLAATLSTHFDKRLYDALDSADQLSCRPDFQLILYPAYFVFEAPNFPPDPNIHPDSQTPPAFILQAEDDPIHVENAILYFSELKDAKVSAELHIYAKGGHGFGLRQTELNITHWPELAEKWMTTILVANSEVISSKK